MKSLQEIWDKIGDLETTVGTFQAQNMAKLERSLLRKFNRDPVEFFETFVMPLLPKQAMGMLESGGRVIEWRGMTSVAGDESPPVPGLYPVLEERAGEVSPADDVGDEDQYEG